MSSIPKVFREGPKQLPEQEDSEGGPLCQGPRTFFFFCQEPKGMGQGTPGHVTPHLFCFQADTSIASPVTENARLPCWVMSRLIFKLQSGETWVVLSVWAPWEGDTNAHSQPCFPLRNVRRERLPREPGALHLRRRSWRRVPVWPTRSGQ